MSGRGHIRKRGRSWELKYDLERAADGRRQIRYKVIKGTRREAQAELARLLTQVADGAHVDSNKVTVAEYLHTQLDSWRAMGTVSAKPTERYHPLIANQILPL